MGWARLRLRLSRSTERLLLRRALRFCEDGPAIAGLTHSIAGAHSGSSHTATRPASFAIDLKPDGAHRKPATSVAEALTRSAPARSAFALVCPTPLCVGITEKYSGLGFSKKTSSAIG